MLLLKIHSKYLIQEAFSFIKENKILKLIKGNSFLNKNLNSLSNNPPQCFMILITVNDSATLYQYELNQNIKSFDVSKIELNKS